MPVAWIKIKQIEKLQLSILMVLSLKGAQPLGVNEKRVLISNIFKKSLIKIVP